MTKKTKIIVISLSILFLAIVAVGYYAYDLNQDINETVEKIYEPLERGEISQKRTEPLNIKETHQPISILLLGVDQRPGDRGRSDTIVVLTINPEDKSMYMFNIPRDTRTRIVGKGFDDKINHAYAFGGVNMALETVENFLDIPIDYYAQVNLEGFVSIIDIIGGVSIDVKQDFDYEGHSFRMGTTQMDGETALKYSRMRYQDPKGDLGRNERQQQIIKALMKKAASVQTITKVDEILGEVSSHVRTNLKKEDMDHLRKNYLEATKNHQSLHIQGGGQKINGVYYYVVPEDERQRVSNTLKEHLKLK